MTCPRCERLQAQLAQLEASRDGYRRERDALIDERDAAVRRLADEYERGRRDIVNETVAAMQKRAPEPAAEPPLETRAHLLEVD